MIQTIVKNVNKHDESIEADLRNARLIQQGLLPKKRHFERLFKDSFSLYTPKEIISGDFYWIGQNNGIKYVVAGDCTGHGVSGALLSVLLMNLFEYAIMNKGLIRTDDILKEVDKRFIESFKDELATRFDNPWADLAIIGIDEENNKMEFSSANRKILKINKEGLSDVIVGSRYPIGGWQLEINRHFNAHIIPFRSGDIIYLGSDGFQDQLGGPMYKKYKSRRLHEFLSHIYHLPFERQQRILHEEFLNWKGNMEQVDDVCLLGIQL